MRKDQVRELKDGIGKAVKDYARLTGKRPDVNSLVDSASNWIMNNLDRYMHHSLTGHGPWCFPPATEGIYAAHKRQLAANPLEACIDSIIGQLDAYPETASGSIYGACEAKLKRLRTVYSNILSYAWIVALERSISMFPRLSLYRGLILEGRPADPRIFTDKME